MGIRTRDSRAGILLVWAVPSSTHLPCHLELQSRQHLADVVWRPGLAARRHKVGAKACHQVADAFGGAQVGREHRRDLNVTRDMCSGKEGPGGGDERQGSCAEKQGGCW